MANDKIQAMHVQVAEKLIQQLKEGTAPWQKPWSTENTPAFELPYNAVTGNRYKGINVFSLLTACDRLFYLSGRILCYRNISG